MQRQLLAVIVGVAVTTLVGVAQSGQISSEEDYDAAMKDVGATFRALQSDMEARDGEAALAGTAKLVGLFERVQAFWTSHNVPAAAAIAAEATGAANAITAAIESQAFQEIAPAQETLAGTCQACHGEYRERVDGNARIKPGVL